MGLREYTTVITDDGLMIDVRNPRLMTPIQMMKYESLDGKPVHQMMYFFECVLVHKEDIEELEKMPGEEIARLLTQIISDFSSGEDE